MPYENTFVLLKPDAFNPDRHERILDILDENGYDLFVLREYEMSMRFFMQHLSYKDDYAVQIGQKMLLNFDKKKVERSQSFLAGKEAEEIGDIMMVSMAQYLSSGRTMACIFGGENAIAGIKDLCGATFPEDAAPTSIRGMFSQDSFAKCVAEKRAPYNIIHAADSVEEAAHQMGMWFPDFDLSLPAGKRHGTGKSNHLHV